MSRAAWLPAAAFAAAVCSAPPVAAQIPAIVNARIETRSVGESLAREIEGVVARGTAVWVGYRLPMIQRPRATWADTGTRGRCRLEPSGELMVLARIEARRVVELRPSAVDCDLDAGGMPLVWLTAVRPDDSVAWLSTLVRGADDPRDRIANAALMAIGLVDAPSSPSALVAFARDGQRARVRAQALVWLAQRASAEAGAAIIDALDRDPELEVKRQAVFALSRLPDDQATPRLIDVATSNRSMEVRRQAMFWLGQSKDPRAVDFFAQILLK